MPNKEKHNAIIASALALFSKYGFHNTTIAQIAKNIGISAGSIYSYFPSKNSLAKAAITFVTRILAKQLRVINEKEASSQEKITLFVQSYLTFVSKHPEMIEYFFKVYLTNKEIFSEEGKSGFELAQDFINEVEKLIDDGVKSGEFRAGNFYIAFSSIVGILGAITFLSGEKVLDKNLDIYTQDLSNSICRALS
ncbi:MAG: TetR family transcriptional regulator [Sulfurovum sp.]|nr:MAG: TetR family transcriptional regulator [Sulfurovum sp.]